MPAIRSSAFPVFPHRRRLLPAVALGLAFFVAACDSGSQEPEAGAQQAPPPAVTVAPVSLGSVEVHEDYAGRVTAAREVQVRARVEGILEERLYDEGAVVTQGEPLFRIDPQPFEVAVLAAEAERSTAEAELQQAERDWTRISRLFERNTISERERDNARARLDMANAALAAADARLKQAELELGYTRVEAPLAGVTSLEVEPEGSLVSRGTLLTTIVQQNPVHVRFSLPEDDAVLQRTALRAMSHTNGDDFRREATLLLPDGSVYPEPGEIDFTASTIDPRTGTVSARAVFRNPEGAVVPGQFVRVRVLLRTLEEAAVVPDEAVGQGPQGPQVFVVDQEDVARVRPVELGPMVQAGRVVLSGLEEGDRLVVNGQVSLQDGIPVTPETAAEEDEAAGATAEAAQAEEAG